MNKVLLILPFLVSIALATPPIEGGKSISMNNLDYIDILKLELAEGSNCTGTKVSPTLILTAAHCVNGLNANVVIPAVGVVTKVYIHPKYKEAKQQHLATPKSKISAKRLTLHDIAFIEIQEKLSEREIKYPQIISPSNTPTVRKKVELAGYGAKSIVWDGKSYVPMNEAASIQIAQNDWTECPEKYLDSSIEKLAEFASSVTEPLSIRARRVHKIINSNEEIITDGKGMILPGDSGSPALERDKDNSFIVSGVASNIIKFDDDSGEAKLEIEVNGTIVESQNFSEMPDDWGVAGKSDLKFPEIMNKMREQNLLTPEGNLKPGVTIKRSYTRYTKGNFADLSHPDNQTFINSVMK